MVQTRRYYEISTEIIDVSFNCIVICLCSKKLSSSVKNRYLYWASASNCFTGITTPPAHLLGINVVARMPLEGGPIELVWDYSIEPHGEQEIPVGLDFDDTSKTLLVSVEGPVRRIDFIDVTSKSRLRFIQNSSFNSQLRSLALFEAGNILISRSAAIELFTSSGNRLTLGANPWVNNPQGACTGSNTQILRVLTTPKDISFMSTPTLRQLAIKWAPFEKPDIPPPLIAWDPSLTRPTSCLPKPFL